MFCLTPAGPNCYDVWTKRKAYAGIIAQKPAGHWVVYFNSNATRGSARKFKTSGDAITYIRDRRIKKGWRV